MIPPSTRGSSLSVTRRHSFTTISAVPRTTQLSARTFWSWRSGRNEYASHIDPLFQRFAKHRTMRTRAQLLEKLKRRGRFEWDLNQRPFFTPKHILASARSASHTPYDGNGNGNSNRSGSRPYTPFNEAETDTKGEDGYELSAREKEWKDRMEYMRKRIETDPYEAVFGKRFEPFWSPLVPSWMREEMGLRHRWDRVNLAKDKLKEQKGAEEEQQVDMGSRRTEGKPVRAGTESSVTQRAEAVAKAAGAAKETARVKATPGATQSQAPRAQATTPKPAPPPAPLPYSRS